MFVFFFCFNDTATTEIYTLSYTTLFRSKELELVTAMAYQAAMFLENALLAKKVAAEIITRDRLDRKSTRLNSSHANISYAVFCLKKKKYQQSATTTRNLHHPYLFRCS